MKEAKAEAAALQAVGVHRAARVVLILPHPAEATVAAKGIGVTNSVAVL